MDLAIILNFHSVWYRDVMVSIRQKNRIDFILVCVYKEVILKLLPHALEIYSASSQLILDVS